MNKALVILANKAIWIELIILFDKRPHHGDHATGPDAVIHSSHAHVVGVLSPLHVELSSHEARAVVDYEHAALDPDGAALLEPGVQVGAVAHALMVLASKVPVLVEDDLKQQKTKNYI